MSLRVRWIGFLCLALLSAAFSCCRDAGDDGKESDVYIAGSVRRAGTGVPCLWKNGARTELSATEGCAYAVFVSGGRVYVAGYLGLRPGYWDDGAWNELSLDGDGDWGVASSLLASSGDLYVVGHQNYKPCYWKNGVRTDLELKPWPGWNRGSGASLFVSDRDLIVAGSVAFSGCYAPCDVACYWRNGVRIELDESYSVGTDVSVSGGDVYVSGHFSNRPCYWRNGARIDLETRADFPFGAAQAIHAAWGMVHVAGWMRDSRRGSVPCLWSDGVRRELEVADAAAGGQAHSLFVEGNDCYVAGWSSSTTPFRPCYWKNGVRTDLSVPEAGDGWALSVFVLGD